MGGNLDTVDCPVVDDHRKIGASIAYRPPWVWPTDYVISSVRMNVSSELADEPSRNVLVTEPNMPRGATTVIAEVYNFMDWGTADRLEQTVAGALSFGFVDGHADRIAVPAMTNAYAAEFPWAGFGRG